MLHFSRLKTALIIGVCLIGALLAVPNFIKPGVLPAWVPQPRVNLGLDLQGGSYLLLEVDLKTVLKERLVELRSEVVQALVKARVPHGGVAVRDQGVSIDLAEADVPAARKALADVLAGRTAMSAPLFVEAVEGSRLTLTLSPAAIADLELKTIEQSVSIVRRRIDETGVNEPVVARRGHDRILVELPGVSDPDRIKRLLGSTAKMTFRLVAPSGSQTGAETELLPYAEAGRAADRLAVLRKVEVDGANLTNASAGQDLRTGEWVVHFTLDRVGARRFADVSTRHVGEPFAIVLDNKVISAPVIREPILGGQGQISGNFTVEGANDLAVLLRAGALPAPLNVVEERTIGPGLGADSIHAGLLAIAAGFIFVVGFIVATYGLFGVFAAVALVANLALTLAGLSLLGATLTLPGIAGILLALGMAVDANILINERAREEARKTNAVVTALESGFRRAYRTILDANVTTLIKMLILFVVATGAIRGFAITISMGILISMFTAIVLVRLLISQWLRIERPKSLHIGTRWHVFPEGTAIPFMQRSLLRPHRLGGDQLGLDRACHLSGTPHGRRVRRRHRHRGPRAGAGRPRSVAHQARLHRSWPGASPGIRLCERRAVAVRATNRRERGSADRNRKGAQRRRKRRCRGPSSGASRSSARPSAANCCMTAVGLGLGRHRHVRLHRLPVRVAVRGGRCGDDVPRSHQDRGLLCLDGLRVQSDVDRGDPHDHGLLDQR